MKFVYIVFFTCCAFAQFGCGHLLYPAERRVLIQKNMIIDPPDDLNIPIIKEDGSKIGLLHAWLFHSKSKDKKAVVVHFHGNGENLTTHFLFFHWLREFGYDYLIFDYRGYGISSDARASQEKTVEDGLAIFNYVREKYPNLPVVAIGQSLGSNVLVRTLQEMNDKKLAMPILVVLDSSFLSYKQAASSVMSQRWFLYPLKPLSYLVISDEWSARSKVKLTPSLPALFFHGTNDPIINIELGKENFEKWPGPKHFITQEKGGHTAAFSDRFIKINRPILVQCIESIRLQPESFKDCIEPAESKIKSKGSHETL